MASKHYKTGNLTTLQQGTQGPNSAVSAAAQNITDPPTQTPNQQSNVAFTERRAEMKGQGMQIKVHEVAIRTKSSKTNVRSPNVKGPQKAATNNQPQLPSPGHLSFPSSQRISAASPSSSSSQAVPQSPLQITGGCAVPDDTAGQSRTQRGAEPAEVCLERTGNAEKTDCELNLQKVEVRTPNVTVGAVRGDVLVQGERRVVRQKIVHTNNGQISLQQYNYTERVFYRRIVEMMYIEALKEPEDPVEPKLKENCIDCCCQACQAFSCTDIFDMNEDEDEGKSSASKKIKNMTPILRRGRSRGWVMHNEMIFPLIKNTFRTFWVITQTLMVMVALCFSIVRLGLGKNLSFNILHFVLTILGSILTIIDGMILCQCCGKFCCSNCEHTSEEAESDETSRLLHRDESNPTCKQCIENTKGMFDIGRMILAEIIFYPLLICDIFEVIANEAYTFSSAEDGVGFVLFAISLGLVFFFVYIVRIIVLILANYHSQKSRSPPSIAGSENFDPTISQSAFYFQSYFVIHVLAQMVAQILMIVTIGIGIHEENKDSSNQPIKVSSNLWYMIVAGYVLPVFGLFTFFVVTYFWVQEFPIGICVDVLSILQQPGIEELLKLKKTKEEGGEKLSKINRYIHFSELKQQFKSLCETEFKDKFCYPFKSPQMVIVSIVYAFLQLGFVIAASHSLGGEWAFFYVPAGIIGYLANIYVFTVATFWSSIIAIVSSIIAIVSTLCLGLIILGCFALVLGYLCGPCWLIFLLLSYCIKECHTSLYFSTNTMNQSTVSTLRNTIASS